jgi:hypothetical protein
MHMQGVQIVIIVMLAFGEGLIIRRWWLWSLRRAYPSAVVG